MDIETKGLGAGSYPEPREELMKTIKTTINVEYECITEVPESWTDEDINEDIRENLRDYLSEGFIKSWEVD